MEFPKHYESFIITDDYLEEKVDSQLKIFYTV
jgi:uncharacterized protein YozE (UPF0346 family)